MHGNGLMRATEEYERPEDTSTVLAITSSIDMAARRATMCVRQYRRSVPRMYDTTSGIQHQRWANRLPFFTRSNRNRVIEFHLDI